MPATLSGQLQTWHKVTLDFTANRSFQEEADTFRDYRLDVTFANAATGETIRVPGFFAADGDAANTNATSGDVWRVNFNPPSEGQWTYQASFRNGNDIAASVNPNAGSATDFDGATGSFDVRPTDKTGDDFRAKGMLLQDEGTHYLQHQGDGDYFVRGGPGVPENLLATADFDGWRRGFSDDNDATPGGDSAGNVARHDFSNHLSDYGGDGQTWDDGRGKAILGAVNYLAEQGQNTIYVLTNTIDGDGDDVGPWVGSGIYSGGALSSDQVSTYDVSKLAQWEIVFDHMDAKGIYKNLLLQETENDQMLDGRTGVSGSSLSVERMVYMREMVARFGHNNGIQWNLGEENTNSNAQREDMAEWMKAVDGYDHLVVVHSYPGQINQVYDPLLGVDAFDGTSFQTGANSIRAKTIEFRDKSDAAGDPWVLSWDEDLGSAAVIDAYSNNPDSSNEKTLREAFWGTLTAGGSGGNWYIKGNGFGGHSFDQNLDDFKGFASMWTWTAAATDFFNTYIPFHEMTDADNLTRNSGDFVMADPGQYYVIYLPYGEAGEAQLDLNGHGGESFDVFWYNPREGGALISDGQIGGGGVRAIGAPPEDGGKDWVVFVRNTEQPDRPASVAPVAPIPPPPLPPAPEPAPIPDAEVALWLVDAATDKRVALIEDGATLDAGLLSSGSYSVEAVADPSLGVQSVRMTLSGRTQTESVAPFALFGDTNGDFAGGDAPDGSQSIRVELFSGRSGGGTKLGDTTLGFEIAAAPLAPPPPPANLAPNAAPDTVVTEQDEAVTIDVLANDGDPNGDVLTLSIASGADNGSIEIRDGRIVYTPNGGFFGADDFTYRITDGGGLSDTAGVAVTVAGVPDAPEPPAPPAPTEPVTPSTPFDLVFSDSSDRSDAQDLQDAVLSGDSFVFTRGTDGVRQVQFYLDDPETKGAPAQTERVAFYDFAGTAGRIAKAWDTSTLEDGAHTITARVTAGDGSVTLITESFLIDNAPEPTAPPGPPPDFTAPFDTSGAAFALGQIRLYGFAVDGDAATIGASGDRIGVSGAGSASEIDFRPGADGGETIGVDFGAAVAAMTIRLANLANVNGATEAGLLRAYDAAGALIEEFLLKDGTEFDLSFDSPVRYATLQASGWVDGADPGWDPDISLVAIEAEYIL